MLAEFIDLILTLCFTLVPFAAAGFVAFVVCSIVFKIADKKSVKNAEKRTRRKLHQICMKCKSVTLMRLY